MPLSGAVFAVLPHIVPVNFDVVAAFPNEGKVPEEDDSGLDHKHGVDHKNDHVAAEGPVIGEMEPPEEKKKKRPLRLLLDDSTSDASDGLRFRGDKAYCIRGIRDERIVDRHKEYFVAWEGYSSSEATWEPAMNVNREAVSQWNQNKNFFLSFILSFYQLPDFRFRLIGTLSHK